MKQVFLFYCATFPSLEVPATCPVAMVTMSGCTLRLRGEAGNQDANENCHKGHTSACYIEKNELSKSRKAS